MQAARRLQGHDHVRSPEAGTRRAPVGGRRQGEEEGAKPDGKASFSLRKGQKLKLKPAARKLSRKKHKLVGYVTVTIKRPGTSPAVLSHRRTLKAAPKKKRTAKQEP